MVFVFDLSANNLQITNIELKNQNTANDTYVIEFDVAWLNSWRTPTLENNWDAVYLFVKYRQIPSTTWTHGVLELSGESVPAAATLQYTGGGKGCLLYKSGTGIGLNNWDDIQVVWDYGADGVSDSQPVEVSILGFEMVHIPQGSFYLGDNGTEESGNFKNGDNQNPFHLTSENSLTLGGTAAGSLTGDNQVEMLNVDDFFSSITTLPAAYPKGYNSIYVMKYEISQGAYVEFLNILEPAQAANRFADQYGQFSNTIDDAGTDPVYTSETPERALNYANYPDAAAYADWSAMRLMTELEFEKICRGTVPALANELATGSNLYSTNTWTLVDAGLSNETISNPEAGVSNINIDDNDSDVLRNGVFAGSAVNANRAETGASYYGVMEMSGNVYELVINIGTLEGRAYTSGMGDGVLDTNGDHNETASGWPLVSNSYGSGVRGGSNAFGSGESAIRARVSNRELTNFDISTRYSDVGFRLVLNDF